MGRVQVEQAMTCDVHLQLQVVVFDRALGSEFRDAPFEFIVCERNRLTDGSEGSGKAREMLVKELRFAAGETDNFVDTWHIEPAHHDNGPQALDQFFYGIADIIHRDLIIRQGQIDLPIAAQLTDASDFDSL